MRTNSQSTTSQLPRVLLQVNPGLTRQLSTKLAVMDKLREKNSRAADYGRRRFMEELERRREFRSRLYARHYRMDPETRRAVDAIKEQNRLLLEQQQLQGTNGSGSHRGSRRARRQVFNGGFGTNAADLYVKMSRKRANVTGTHKYL